MKAKRQFIKGQIYQGKEISTIYRVLDHYLLKFTDKTEKIIYFKDL